MVECKILNRIKITNKNESIEDIFVNKSYLLVASRNADDKRLLSLRGYTLDINVIIFN